MGTEKSLEELECLNIKPICLATGHNFVRSPSPRSLENRINTVTLEVETKLVMRKVNRSDARSNLYFYLKISCRVIKHISLQCISLTFKEIIHTVVLFLVNYLFHTKKHRQL